MIKPRLHLLLPLFLLSAPMLCRSDGIAIDKVYRPYVEWSEREVEWRMTAYEDPDRDSRTVQEHRLGLGRAFGDRWFGEIYLIAADKGDGNFSVDAYEAEILHQLTEQGELWADFGLLLEIEKERGVDAWEASAAMLIEKEFGPVSGTLNVGAGAEWGDGIRDEMETRLAAQIRYRWSPLVEPAVELHMAEETRALGPLLLGDIPMSRRRNIH